MSFDVVVNGRFLSRRITGVERYGREILRCLGEHVQVVQPLRYIHGVKGHVWEQIILPGRIPAKSTLWSPANTGPLAVSNQVLTIHDLTPLEHPEWFRPTFTLWYRLILPLLVHRVRRVVTLSEHVRAKLLARFNLSHERVIAIPAGVNLTCFHPLDLPANKRRYILFVGSLEPRKNLSVLLEAWKLIENQYPDVSLVLAGITGRVFRRFNLPADIDRVQFAGYVSEDDLPALYAGATVFVLPSLDEGFGLTVLEAMACGTPVLASNGGALPEVVGDAGILFDPNNPSSLARSLSDCLTDGFLNRTLRQKGLERAEHFSWPLAAELIWQILDGMDAT